ncbi:hypothetical protein [Flavobacterium sp. MMS24-S5]|uniref:hypothetical protein n=1 Tax=Flavobacterium sp. MMS24-S5 TaxID=3416605 RepID=UPI003CFC8113
MKKFILFLLGFTAVSCVNDEVIGNETSNSLSTIKVDEYRDDVFLYSKIMHFSNDKLTKVTYSDNGTEQNYENYSYNSKGLLCKAVRYEYPENLYTVTTFSYDSEERIVEINSQRDLPNSETNNLEDKFTFTYLTDKIVSSIYYKNTFMNSTAFLLNSNQEPKRINAPSSYSKEYSYDNGNIVSITSFHPDMSSNTTTYSYSSLKNEYDYSKFLYGEKWKLNKYLIGYTVGITTGEGDALFSFSKNLISEYRTISVPSNPGLHNNHIKYDYVINDKNLLEKKTITNVRSSTKYSPLTVRTEYLYTYK